MKYIAPIIAATALIAMWPLGAVAQGGSVWNTSEGFAPVSDPYAPANLEQQLSNSGNWQPNAPQAIQLTAPAQYAPFPQTPPVQQYAPAPQYYGSMSYTAYGGAPYGSYGGYTPNYNYGGYPGGYGGYSPYGTPFGGGYGGLPFNNGFNNGLNNGGFGSPYGNIPSGNSPFFGGNSNTPFGFW